MPNSKIMEVEQLSIMDDRFPKFHKGHDIDAILTNMRRGQMSRAGEMILFELVQDYQKKCEEEYQRRIEEGRPITYDGIVKEVCERRTKKNEETEEMSAVDPLLPKLYKGYDVDVLTQKLRNGEHMKEIETAMLSEAQNTYYSKEAGYNMDLRVWIEIHKMIIHIDPAVMTDENRNLPHTYLLYYERPEK